jgi:hypothetical protein
VRGSGRLVARLERRGAVQMAAWASHWARDMQAVDGLAMATRGHCVAQAGSSSVAVHTDRLDCWTRSWSGRAGMSLPSLTVTTDTGGEVSRRRRFRVGHTLTVMGRSPYVGVCAPVFGGRESRGDRSMATAR